MKVLSKKEELCIGCQLCEEKCVSAYFKEKNRLKSCILIEKAEGDKNLINVCSQCGKCIDICQVKAIYRDHRGVIKIKKDICVGCFMCVGFCPEEAMRQHDEYIEPFKCIACGLCAKECPSGAIFVEEKAELVAEEATEETAAGLKG